MSSTAYLESKQLTLDAIKCKEGNPCGKICIPKKSKCAVGSSSLKSPGTKNKAGYITTGVAIGGGLSAATIAAGLGVLGTAKLHKMRKRYQENFAVSAVRAENESKNIKAPNLGKDVKAAILTVGGFGTKDAYSESEVLKKNIESLGIKGLYIEPQSYAEFNIPTEPKDDATKKQAHQEAKNLFIKTVVKTGYNPVAVSVAAKIIAYKKANPDKEYQLMGHSGGGLVVQEAHEILHKAGIQIKTTAIGSPDVGLIPGTGDLVTATSKQDNILKLTGGRGVNPKKFDNVPAHGQNAYFADNDFRNFIKDRLTPTRKDRFDKATCKIGKNCKNICIPKKSICKSKGQNSTPGSKLRTPLSNRLAVASGLTMGAAIAGLPIAAYLVQKTRFQAGFSKSAELAKEQAKIYKVPEKVTTGFRSIDDQQLPGSVINSGIKSIDTGKPAQQVTFFVGGIASLNGLAGDHIGQQVGRMFPNHQVVAIETPEQDVPYKQGDSVGSPSYIKKAANALLRDNIRQGRSQVAVRIAARAYAYNQAHPDLPINLIGHSGGGMPVRESAEILKRMGVKDVKVVTAGSPYFGLTPPVGLSLIDTKNDPVDKIYGKTMPNKTQVETPGPNGHSFYFAETAYKLYKPGSLKHELATDIWDNTVVNKSTQKVLDKYFDRSAKQKLDSKGKPCGKGYISSRLKCREGLESPANSSSSKAGLSNKSKVGLGLAIGLVTPLAAGAAFIGVPAASYATFRNQYREGFKASAMEAENKSFALEKQLTEEMSKKLGIPAEKLTNVQKSAIVKADKWDEKGNVTRSSVYAVDPKRPSIGFTIGGFSDQGDLGFGLANQMSADMPDHSLIPLTNKKVNITPEMTWLPMNDLMGQELDDDGKGGKVKRGYLSRRGFDDFMGKVVGKTTWDNVRDNKIRPSEQYKSVEPVARELIRYKSDLQMLYNNATKKKNNADAIDAAAHAMMYKRLFPDKDIHFIGHSGGGIAAAEAMEILKKKGIKSKSLLIATPYFGLTKLAPEELRSIGSREKLEKKEEENNLENKPKSEKFHEGIKHKLPVDKMMVLPSQNLKPITVPSVHNWLENPSGDDYKKGYRGYGQLDQTYEEIRGFFYGEGKRQRESATLRRKLTVTNQQQMQQLVFGGKKVSQDSLTSDALPQIQRQLSILLSRSYGKQIVKIGGIKVSLDNTVTGIAQDALGKILNFTFKDDKLTYELSKKLAKIDSADLWTGLVANYRQDKSTVKKKCGKGLNCGGTCIASNDTCRLKLNQIASPSEISRLRQSIVKFKLEQNQSIVPVTTTSQTVTETVTTQEAPVKPNKYVTNPETGTPYTIRELRKQASEKRIYGYGSMTIKELQGTLQLYDQKPESRDRITRGVTKRTGFSTRAIAVSGLSGRGTPLERRTKRNLKNTADVWRKLEALAKFASSSPVSWSAAAVGAFLIGRTIKSYEQTKQSYREGFTESARIAEERASKLNIQHPVEKDGVPTLLPNGKPRMSSRINQDNITFAVGSGKGYGAQEMKAMLQQEKDPTNTKDYWFTHSNYVVPFDLKEFGTPRPIGGGEPNVASTVVNGVGGIVRNFTRKRNQDAVDLAAQIYAHAIAVSPDDGKTLVNRNKKINIVAHCNGGLVTKEALEIVSRMELKGSPTGKKVLEQVNAVYLGTPHFGFAENVSRRQRTIVSPEDPISILPTFGDGARQQWISSVKGGTASDYLKDERVRDSIRESFGYYQGSPEEVKRRVKKRGDSANDRSWEGNDSQSSSLPYFLEKELVRLDFAKRCKTGVPCGDICLPVGRKCRLTNIKLDPRKVSARIGRGAISKTVGGLGQDLERAYLRTSRLVKVAQRKSNKEELPLTKKEQIKERLAHEGRLAGVLLGQGTISKTIKSVDEKLIDLSDFISETPEKIADAIAHVKEKLSNLIQRSKKDEHQEHY